MSKPIAVLISDIHFSLQTLPIATKALEAAIGRAEQLQTPLIIAGDLQDTKAIIRAEVMNELLRIISGAKIKVIILRGNHDQVHEKSEENALNYLKPYAEIIDQPQIWYPDNVPVLLVPYQSKESMEHLLKKQYKRVEIMICHQGFLGAQMGDYLQDKSSISPDLVKNFTVISGHYHKHQTIGTVTYIGSPYTITFGEANDGPKGFLILNDDGTFEREILNLRRHIKIECHIDKLVPYLFTSVGPNDLLWLKIIGPQSQLKKVNKKELGQRLLGHSNFKLDLIPEEPANDAKMAPQSRQTDHQILDETIEAEAETEEQKKYLKKLWRELM